MAVNVEDLTRLRRMVAEPTTAILSDTELVTVIEQYPLEIGFDLNAAARDVWEMKAAMYVGAEQKFSADGASFEYGNLYEKAMAMVSFFEKRISTQYSKGASFGTIMRADVED